MGPGRGPGLAHPRWRALSVETQWARRAAVGFRQQHVSMRPDDAGRHVSTAKRRSADHAHQHRRLHRRRLLRHSVPVERLLWLQPGGHGRTRSRLRHQVPGDRDRKSTRLNSSHLGISYAVLCLKNDGIIHLEEPLDGKLYVALIFQLRESTIRSTAQMLFPMWATQGWMQPFLFVELSDAIREPLDTNL